MVDWLTGEQAVEAMRPFEQQLQTALDNGGEKLTLEDVRQQLRDQTAQLWVVPWQAAAVTKVVDDTLVVWLVGGRMDVMPAMLAAGEDWARGVGCKGVMVYGRRGWERSFLRAEGYRHEWTIMVKPL